MHYTGTLTSGAKFDSSRDRGKEFSTAIGVGQVIQGWDQGVPQMTLGEHAILRISAACGYGAQGSPPVIPPNSDLVFDVELNGINGRRAGVLPVSMPASFAPAAPLAAAPIAAAKSNLPRCISSSCGHAISFDTSGGSRPLCLCNPICEQMRGTPGVLPCCPGLQEVCLDPFREPSPAPPVAATATFSSSPINAVASFAPAAGSVLPAATRAVLPAAAPATIPAATTINFAATSSILPTCRVNSCGKAMAIASNPTVAACACDISCMAPGASLPCCQGFAEVCQAPMPMSAPPATVVGAAVMGGSSMGTSCTVAKMGWAEQPACDKKRWAVKNGQCKKVCPAIDMNLGISYYPTGQTGKSACQTAANACRGV